MKASEVRLMVAIAAQYGCKLLKTDTKQAFLNGKIGDEKMDYYKKMPNRLPNFCLIDTKSCLIVISLKSGGPMRESEICVASDRSRIAKIPRSI
jgi:hypothetical protein